jgi:drug/metabolite transporter (DMT)-like permease
VVPSTDAHGSRGIGKRPIAEAICRRVTTDDPAAPDELRSQQTLGVIAIIFGLATAVLWAATLLGSARSSRLIGAWSTLAWVMLIGLAFAVPLVVFGGGSVQLDGRDIFNLAVAGIANSGGLLLVYTALRRGKIGVVGPIVSTEGAIGATLAIIGGDPVSGVAIGLLLVITIGVVMAASEPTPDPLPEAPILDSGPRLSIPSAAVTAAIAFGGAVLFGINLYVTSRIARDLPIAWAILPARVAGVIGVSIPLILTRRLRLARAAVPFVILVGCAEVGGVATFSIGARENAAVASVIASQFAGMAALAAFLFFGERLGRLQVAGVIVIAIGVGALAAAQA